MTNQITQESLLAAGYKRFTQNDIWQYTNVGWQKRFDDDKGKKYFITLREYDNSDYPNLLEMRGQYSFQPETQFEANGVTFDITMHSPKSIEEMEEFFENMWKKLDCKYYEDYTYYIN